MRLTFFCMSAVTIAVELGIIIDQLVNVAAEHSLVADMQESVTAQLLFFHMPTTVHAAVSFTFELLSAEMWHQHHKYFSHKIWRKTKPPTKHDIRKEPNYFKTLEHAWGALCYDENGELDQYRPECQKLDLHKMHCDLFTKNSECKDTVSYLNFCSYEVDTIPDPHAREAFCFNYEDIAAQYVEENGCDRLYYQQNPDDYDQWCPIEDNPYYQDDEEDEGDDEDEEEIDEEDEEDEEEEEEEEEPAPKKKKSSSSSDKKKSSKKLLSGLWSLSAAEDYVDF